MALPSSKSDLLVSETFVSLQGEGVSTGTPAAFLRLGNCNLACSYCDTPYTWDETRYDLSRELAPRSIEEVSDWVQKEGPGRLIITGGEPLLQHQKLLKMVALLDQGPRVFLEVETNGTLLPNQALLARVDQWNVSPKLAGSGEPLERRIKPEVLAGFLETGRAYFKFVVTDAADVAEVDELSKSHNLPAERILLMPEARSAEELRLRSSQVAAWALSRRMRFSSRLHLELYGGRRGT